MWALWCPLYALSYARSLVRISNPDPTSKHMESVAGQIATTTSVEFALLGGESYHALVCVVSLVSKWCHGMKTEILLCECHIQGSFTRPAFRLGGSMFAGVTGASDIGRTRASCVHRSLV